MCGQGPPEGTAQVETMRGTDEDESDLGQVRRGHQTVAPAAQSLQVSGTRGRGRGPGKEGHPGGLAVAWAHPRQAAPGRGPALKLVTEPERALPPEGHQAAAAQSQHLGEDTRKALCSSPRPRRGQGPL